LKWIKDYKHLIANLLEFERTINSRVSHYLSGLMEKEELTRRQRHELIQLIKQIRDRKDASFSTYNGEQTWEYVAQLTFGETKRLVFWMHDHRQDVYLKVIDGYSFLKRDGKRRLNELNNLRNNLFHLKPLTVYLTCGIYRNEKLSNAERKKAVRWISKLGVSQEMRDNLNEICYYSDNYVKIKNSLRNVD